MRVIWAVPAIALTLAACHHRQPSPAQKAAQDARDIAMVEKAQTVKPPPQSIDLQPIGPEQARKYSLQGSRCTFYRGGAGGTPIVVTLPTRAWIKVSGQMKTLASDPGSDAFPFGTWSKYEGKAQSLRIERAPVNGLAGSEASQRSPARLNVRDAYDQLIYTARGELACGQ